MIFGWNMWLCGETFFTFSKKKRELLGEKGRETKNKGKLPIRENWIAVVCSSNQVRVRLAFNFNIYTWFWKLDWICVVLVRFWEYDELLKMLMNMLLITCFCDVLSDMMYIRPVNVFVNHFGWLGDQNWVFGWKWGLKIVVLKLPRWAFAQASKPSLKRAT